MNREQRRTFVKKAQSRGVDKATAQNYAEIIGNDTGPHTPRQEIGEGEKVKLNIESIKSRKNYERMSDLYKEFINSNTDTVFTAHVERPTLISFVEEPKWLFWCGDLTKVRENAG